MNVNSGVHEESLPFLYVFVHKNGKLIDNNNLKMIARISLLDACENQNDIVLMQ